MKKTTELPERHEWRIGSNVLCNYMKKPEYLEKILQNQAIIPRYNMEVVGYLGVKGLETICFPMTCFCDIPFSSISSHMSRYGTYGIGFDKNAVLQRNKIQPIHYVSEYSTLAEDFRSAFTPFFQTERKKSSPVKLLNYLVTSLLYMKPIWGKETDEKGNVYDYVYQDECEWRYVPTIIPDDYHLIIPQSETTNKVKEAYTTGLEEYRESWFHFDWEDVCYIIVPDEVAVNRIISAIKVLKMKTRQKDLLISKIEISRRIRSDR